MKKLIAVGTAAATVAVPDFARYRQPRPPVTRAGRGALKLRCSRHPFPGGFERFPSG